MLFFRKAANVVEAAALGAMQSIKIISSVIVNVIACIAIVTFLDSVLSYLGSRLDFPDLSFKVSFNMILHKSSFKNFLVTALLMYSILILFLSGDLLFK